MFILIWWLILRFLFNSNRSASRDILFAKSYFVPLVLEGFFYDTLFLLFQFSYSLIHKPDFLIRGNNVTTVT